MTQKRGILTGGEVINPLIFTGFISQTGTNAPTFTSLLDQITGVTWARTAAGTFTASKTGAFPEGKTLPGVAPEIYQDENGNCFMAVWTDVNTITFYSATSSTMVGGVLTDLADDLYINRPITISVFA